MKKLKEKRVTLKYSEYAKLRQDLSSLADTAEALADALEKSSGRITTLEKDNKRLREDNIRLLELLREKESDIEIYRQTVAVLKRQCRI